MKHSLYISLLLLLSMTAISLAVLSCEQNLDIKNDYDFSVTMQKFRTDIVLGETVELEYFISREGDYVPTEYYISYFIRKGKGTLSDSIYNVLEKNTYYKVNSDTFKLYYTAHQGSNHQIELIIRDSFGKKRELTIDLSTNN